MSPLHFGMQETFVADENFALEKQEMF